MPAAVEPLSDSDASFESLEPVRWTYWPAALSPYKTAGLVLAIPAAGFLAWYRVGSVGSGVLAFLLLLAAAVNYLAPIYYTLTSRGIRIRGLGSPRLLRWSRIESARIAANHATLLVSPDHGASAYRLRVRFGREPVDCATALRQHLLDAGAPVH